MTDDRWRAAQWTVGVFVAFAVLNIAVRAAYGDDFRIDAAAALGAVGVVLFWAWWAVRRGWRRWKS